LHQSRERTTWSSHAWSALRGTLDKVAGLLGGGVKLAERMIEANGVKLCTTAQVD
jgi:hypothetical protein